MDRVPEPELMDEAEQARAYAEADFAEPHNQFVAQFSLCFPDIEVRGTYLDLGCGPGDITIRFARAHPQVTLHGVDGAQAMLSLGHQMVAAAGLDDRVRLEHAYLPTEELPANHYAGVISNSLLHHLADPDVLWDTIRRHTRAGAPVFVMDLMRPADDATARALVDEHAADEPEVLRHDFYHSLRAAYRVPEVREQLDRNGLQQLGIRAISDRHLIVWGPA
ncbi:MAG: class I SAM-dependent methyltransferase [Planctomycetota bacterium]